MSSPSNREPTKITVSSVLPKHQTQTRRPWYHLITLDLLLYILSRSVFHYAIVIIFWLCLAAVPPDHHRHPWAYGVLWWATFLMIFEALKHFNQWIANGSPRKVDFNNEVVVITGGASGLGRTIAEMLLVKHRGVKVAIIDVKEADETARAWMKTGGEFEDRLWWGCIDVRNSAAVKIIAGRLKEELGRPTMVINNAAMAVNGLALVAGDYEAGLTGQQAERTLMVNTMGNFNVLFAFLGELMRSAEKGNGATVVTVSSLLAHLNPARLSDYSASKAALSSLHHTLTAEIAENKDANIRRKFKTVLVEPGQIHTELFADITQVPWYANFFGPILDVNEIAKAIVKQLECGDSGIIRMPFYSKCMPYYAAMPVSLQRFMRWFSGIDQAIVASKKKR